MIESVDAHLVAPMRDLFDQHWEFFSDLSKNIECCTYSITFEYVKQFAGILENRFRWEGLFTQPLPLHKIPIIFHVDRKRIQCLPYAQYFEEKQCSLLLRYHV